MKRFLSILCAAAAITATGAELVVRKASDLTRVTSADSAKLLILADPAGTAEPVAITVGNLTLGFTPAWSAITGKPTTLSGYGITDPVVTTAGSYSNPAWITALAWSKLTGTPTTLSGYGITDPVVTTAGSYSNPAWITALAWSKLTGTPTTLSGYGITDGQPLDSDLTTYAGITPSANVQSLLGAADYSAMRTQLGLAIGTNVQAYDADLTTYAGITPAANVQSLLGAADYSAMRTLLGLVTSAGGNGAADNGKVPLFGSLGQITTAGVSLPSSGQTVEWLRADSSVASAKRFYFVSSSASSNPGLSLYADNGSGGSAAQALFISRAAGGVWTNYNVLIDPDAGLGTGIGGALRVGGATLIADTTASTSSSTGALRVSGGIGAGGNIYSGDLLQGLRMIASNFMGSTVICLAGAGEYPTFRSGTQGILTLTGGYTAGTDMTRFNFGGTTSSDPSLHFSGTTITIGTADGGTSAGNLAVSGGLIAGGTFRFGSGGTTMQKLVSATATLDFPEILPGDRQMLSISLTTTSIDTPSVALGFSSALPVGITPYAYVSASNTVQVVLTNTLAVVGPTAAIVIFSGTDTDSISDGLTLTITDVALAVSVTFEIDFAEDGVGGGNTAVVPSGLTRQAVYDALAPAIGASALSPALSAGYGSNGSVTSLTIFSDATGTPQEITTGGTFHAPTSNAIGKDEGNSINPPSMTVRATVTQF